MHARAGTIETDGKLEAVDCDRDDVGAGTGALHLHVLERSSFERREGAAHVGRAVGERAAGGQPPVRLQRGLLALRAVDGADTAALEAELEQLLERLRLVVA